MRTNLPIQVHQLLESPGKLLAVNKARSAAWDAAGLNYDTDKYKVPDWMQQGFSAPIRGKDGALNLVMAQLPMNDLYTNGRTMMSSMLPFVLPFIENYVTKQKTFSGAPLTGEKTIPLNGNLNVLGPFLSHLGMADQNAKGTYDVSDTTVNMLNILPIFSRFQDWMYGDPKRVANRNFSVWSAVAGVTERPLNASTMTQAELDYYYLHVVPEVDQLRKQGYPVPTTQDLQGLGYTANQVLQGLGISPGAYSTAAGLNQGGPSTTTSNAAQAAPLSKSY
jgi:hypothetical protein